MDMLGPQDEINKRRSKLLHLLNTTRIVQVEGFEMDADTARKEAARPDGVIPFGYQIAETGSMQAGQDRLLQESKSEIERMGPNPAILARGNESASGRSQLIQQQAGMVEQSRIFSGIDDLMLRIYRQIWARCKQFWRAEKWVRVTDDVGAPKFVGLNQPVMGEQPTVIMGPDGMPALGMEPVQVGVENNVAEMNVDIVVDSTADTAVVAQEQFMALIELVKAGVPFPPDVLIEASSLPKKQAILDKLKQPQQNPMAEAEVKLKAGQAEAEIEKTRAEAERAQAQAAEVQQGLQFNAMMATAMPPPGMTGASPMATV
jgi:hypothetical protein